MAGRIILKRIRIVVVDTVSNHFLLSPLCSVSVPLVEKKMVRLMPNIVRTTPPIIPTIYFISITRIVIIREFDRTYKLGVLELTASYQLIKSKEHFLIRGTI